MLKKRILAQKISEPLARKLAKIYEYKGKEALAFSKHKKLLNKLHLISKEESVNNFHRSQKKTISKKRAQELLKGSPPKNSFEEEMLGYRLVLLKIHKDYKKIRVNSAFVLKLFQELYQFTHFTHLGWKTTNNTVSLGFKGEKWVLLKGLDPKKTPQTMDKLHREFHKLKKDKAIEPIFLISTYLFDFFAIHPFFDGNGRVCRLLLLLFLYQFDFTFVRYVSLEKIIEKTHEDYYISLYHCTRYRKDLVPWWEYVTKVILLSYQDLDKKLKCFNV